MSSIARPVLAEDEEHNIAAVGWISNRLRRVRLGEAPPLALPPDLNEHDRKHSYRDWDEIEMKWGVTPNSEAVVKEVNEWIERYLPSGNQPAGKERQKMLMTLRAVRASRRRRADGALRFELDTELSSQISKVCESLAPLLEASKLRGRNIVQGLFIKTALEKVFSDQALTRQVFDQVGRNLAARKR
jgi:hypothetical protein